MLVIILFKPKSQTASSSTTQSPQGSFWGMLGKACIPPKVKMTVGRILSNIIPSGANLQYRHLMVEYSCVLCGAAGESNSHLFFDCSFAKGVWLSSSLGVRPPSDFNDSLIEWVSHISQILSQSEYDGCLMVFWAIWTARNAKFWGNDMNLRPNLVPRRAMDWWQDFLRVTQAPATLERRANCHRWTKPPLGKFKVNVDGAWDEAVYWRGGLGYPRLQWQLYGRCFVCFS